MGEAASTVFTVLLFIAAFLGSGAYAVLSMADFKAARRGFRATALSFAAIGLVLGTMTSWPLPTRIAVCAMFMAIAGGGLIWALDYLNVREALGIAGAEDTETGKLVSQAQFTKVAELEKFLGGKDESGLRQTFDLPRILQKNIDTQIIRIGFIKEGKEKEFLYNNYTDNNSWIAWTKEGHFTVGPSGVHVEAGPKDVLFLVTTSAYQAAVARLVDFVNSALIPESIKKEVRSFQETLHSHTTLMMQVMDERMHESEDYFLHNMDLGNPHYGVIVSDYATKTIALKPAADHVLNSIAKSWKISH